MAPKMDDAPDRRKERFRALYRECAQPLLGYAVRRVATPPDAADVVAEVFVVAWRRLEDVPRGNDARLWLFGVARRVIANQRRGDDRRNQLADKLGQELVQRVRREERAEEDAALALAPVQLALAQLRENDREVLRLTIWEGLSPTEIATVLSVPPATVRTRLHRARHRLRAALDPDDQSLERWDRSRHVMAGGRTPAQDRPEEEG